MQGNDFNNIINSESLGRLDYEDIKALRLVATDPSMIETLTPEDMDKIGRAISSTFRECSINESEISETERGYHVKLLQWIVKARNIFYNSANDTSRHGALNVLFHKTIITPTNLQALVRMSNPKIRTGTVRCRALLLLHLFANEDYKIYRIPMRRICDDDQARDDNNKPTIFLKELMLTMAEAVCYKSPNCGATTDTDADGKCRYCNAPIAWICLTNTFGAAPGILNDLELLDFWMNDSKMNWVKILCDSDIPDYSLVQTAKVGEPVLSFDFPVFVSLHGQTVAILKKYPTNEKAKHFLRNTLGACHELFRNCMRRIINGDVYATPRHERIAAATAADKWKQILVELQPVISFILAFTRCLSPVPIDRETMSLVRRARMALLEPFLGNATAMADTIATNHLTTALAALFDWQQLHDETDEVRWAKFQKELLFASSSSTTAGRRSPRNRKTFWKEFKNVRKDVARGTPANVQDGEMCANCFVLENDLKREESGYLSKCSKCLQMKYCSRECQVEHWKKAHRTACEGKINRRCGGAAASASGSGTRPAASGTGTKP